MSVKVISAISPRFLELFNTSSDIAKIEKKKAIYLALRCSISFCSAKKMLVNSSEREDKPKKLKLWAQELNNEPGPHEKQLFELNQARINQEN